jgi:D-aspartate ligase
MVIQTDTIPALICGDDFPAYGAVRALVPKNIPIYLVHHTKNSFVKRSRFVRKSFHIIPENDNFIEELHNIANQIGGEAVIIAAGDNYLDSLSRNINSLPDGFRCTFHGWNIVSQIRRKNITYEKCSEIGVPFPRYYHVRSKDDLEEVLSSLDIPFPLILKTDKSNELHSRYGNKVVIARNKQEVRQAYEYHDGFWNSLILSEYISGSEQQLVNLMAVGDTNGYPLEVFMNRKVRSSDRLVACLMEPYYSEILLEMSLKLMKHTGYYGYFNSEFKLDPRDGSLKLMEVNGRVTVTSSHALLHGCNLPYSMYQCALGKTIPLKIMPNGRFERVLWWRPISDFKGCFHSFIQGKLTIGQYFSSLRASRRITEPFWRKDPSVGIFFILSCIRMFTKRLWKKLCRK